MTCSYKYHEISMEEALQMREGSLSAINLRCGECNEQVRPHKAGGGMSAHFEHLIGNPDCSRSDAKR